MSEAGELDEQRVSGSPDEGTKSPNNDFENDKSVGEIASGPESEGKSIDKDPTENILCQEQTTGESSDQEETDETNIAVDPAVQETQNTQVQGDFPDEVKELNKDVSNSPQNVEDLPQNEENTTEDVDCPAKTGGELSEVKEVSPKVDEDLPKDFEGQSNPEGNVSVDEELTPMAEEDLPENVDDSSLPNDDKNLPNNNENSIQVEEDVSEIANEEKMDTAEESQDEQKEFDAENATISEMSDGKESYENLEQKEVENDEETNVNDKVDIEENQENELLQEMNEETEGNRSQEAIDEETLLRDTGNEGEKTADEDVDIAEAKDSNEPTLDDPTQQEEPDSTMEDTIQIGSVTGNADMVDDTEMMDVDENSSQQNKNEHTDAEDEKMKDVEMVEDGKETEKDVTLEKEQNENRDEMATVQDFNDAEMKEGEELKEKEESKITVKEEKNDTNIEEISNKTAEDDDDDVKIIEDGEEDKAKDADIVESSEVKVKDEKDPDDSGEMCLQIASVSGGVDMPDEDKKDVKKEESADVEIKDEVAAKKTLDGKEIKQEVKSEGKPKSTSKTQTCIVCQKIGKCKYNIVRNGDIKHLCDDMCFKQFRSNPTMFLRASSDSQTTKKPDSPVQAPAPAPTQAPPPTGPSPHQERYKTCSICQLMNVKTSKPFLNWQGMDFCGEDCLGKFQGGLNAACNYCGQTVQQASKGKFCSRIGNDVKQFCSGQCFNEHKKRQKLCECCQKDVTKVSDAFVAPVGKEGVFKDFCSQSCLQKYEEKCNRDVEIVGVERPQKSQVPPKGNFQCAVCRKTGPVKHEIKLEGKMNRLCSDPCFSAFQYANKLTMNTCDNCGVYCYNEGMAPQYIQFEGQQKRFCSFMCVNTFKAHNKKVVSCAWCNCKKSNFDMIERVDANNKYQLFCSLNCLSLYRVNLQATSNQAVVCDQCRKFVPAQYHLTMSDASVRNFCSYQCVMTFQSQFSAGGSKTQTPIMNTAPNNQQKNAPQRTPARNTPTRTSARVTSQKQTAQGNVPVISNVVSLAQNTAVSKNQSKTDNGTLARAPQQTTRANHMPALVNSQNQQRSVVTTAQQTPPQQIIIQPPPPKTVKNKSLLCKPFVQTKATSCRPHTQTKETQTEEDWEPKRSLVPVPIPYFIPVPMMMYSQYTPVPMPIPIPIPVPCFIPTTKKSANGIFKHIKEIQERIPSDPLEAELLMMAEAVAGADPESESESDTEDILPTATPDDKKSISHSPSPVPHTEPTPDIVPVQGQPNGEFGEDMLQMALRMATEMTSEPVMDLESSIAPVPVNTEPPPPPPPEEEGDEDYIPVRETRSRARTPKRSGSKGNRRSKRQKVSHPMEQEEKMETSPAPEPEVPEIPPDANMYLKYTYGVNAWKHWVVLKNNQLEKVSKHGSGKLKLFKTDMMGCSADELNYSLCLFVKEVRKPNGEEYAPDSIYYLCLGIQQYLFESSRIDNIFTDMYYEKFTECLNEVLARYEPKLNTAGQLVCRIEEEHLWESKQLGAHSPHVLLNTLVFFNTKYFMLKEVDDHMKLSFTHIMKHWKKTPIGKNNTTGRSVYLRYYCPNPVKVTGDMNQKKKQKEEVPVYEQAENLENPLRCPVKLYEFYLSKCPESIKNRNDAFYLTPERSCVPDSPVWYSTQNLSSEAMNKMLNRARLVREIQEAMLHTQPIYM